MKNLLFTLTLITTLFYGCKKDDPAPEEIMPVFGTVIIEQKIYNTMSIDGLEWTTDNYDGSVGVYYNGVINHTYGKLLTLNQTKQIVLPSGWRTPSVTDYVKLINRYGGFVSYNSTGIINYNILDQSIKPEAVKKLISTANWSLTGTNQSGFNAVSSGYVGGQGQYLDTGVFCALWTSTVYQNGNIFYPVLLGLSTDLGVHEGSFAEYAQPLSSSTDDTKGKGSIRFVRNIP